jgi:hypothetical protein
MRRIVSHSVFTSSPSEVYTSRTYHAHSPVVDVYVQSVYDYENHQIIGEIVGTL